MNTEVDRLAKHILEHFPDEPGSVGQSESAVDVAIRLLNRLKKCDCGASKSNTTHAHWCSVYKP